MSRRLPVILLLVLLPLWLAASYGARYGFMEDAQWVGICVDEASRWECQVRSSLGLMIHFNVLGFDGIGGSRYRVCATGPGRVVVGRAGAGVRVSGAGVVQHDFGCFCGGDCWVAFGPGFPQRLIDRHRGQARSHRFFSEYRICVRQRSLWERACPRLTMRPVGALKIYPLRTRKLRHNAATINTLTSAQPQAC